MGHCDVNFKIGRLVLDYFLKASSGYVVAIERKQDIYFTFLFQIILEKIAKFQEIFFVTSELSLEKQYMKNSSKAT